MHTLHWFNCNFSFCFHQHVKSLSNVVQTRWDGVLVKTRGGAGVSGGSWQPQKFIPEQEVCEQSRYRAHLTLNYFPSCAICICFFVFFCSSA